MVGRAVVPLITSRITLLPQKVADTAVKQAVGISSTCSAIRGIQALLALGKIWLAGQEPVGSLVVAAVPALWRRATVVMAQWAVAAVAAATAMRLVAAGRILVGRVVLALSKLRSMHNGIAVKFKSKLHFGW
jgi:hypothetical protein